MPAYDAFFYSAIFFLVGVLGASVGLRSEILIGTGIVAIFCIFARIFPKQAYIQRLKVPIPYWMWLTIFAVWIPIGALYFHLDDMRLERAVLPQGKVASISATIISDPQRNENNREFLAELAAPYHGSVWVRAPAYPELEYGQVARLSGTMQKIPTSAYGEYLKKERAQGILAFAHTEDTGVRAGSVIRSTLFRFKHSILELFRQVLPAKEAAFLGGLVLGSREEFSIRFKDAMQKSGTTHLVALSGYNITILAWAALALFGLGMRRRWAVVATAIAIVLFAIMTGAEASVVRAAVMGILVLLAAEVGRVYDMRNALTAAALVMVVQNPKVLVFDVGFQLSFLALLGIVYVRPAVERLLRWEERAGFLSWRSNLLTTLSAQMVVLPLLLAQFGIFSPISLLSNIIVLEFVPLTMGLGVLIALLGMVSVVVATPIAWIAWVFLRFKILVIELSAGLGVAFHIRMGAGVVIVYYGCILALIFYARRIFPKSLPTRH